MTHQKDIKDLTGGIGIGDNAALAPLRLLRFALQDGRPFLY